ncbi:MAG: hypothetical protein JO250_02540 [Armatimonadetes bacterium]|nr:hypothetical protein [Armatimonadota bacterium]
MMRKHPYWRYWLLLTALAAVVLIFCIYDGSFTVAILLLGINVCERIYLALRRNGRLRWLFPCGLIFAAVLAAAYYVADLVFFPHSPRAFHRLHDACWAGLISSLVGFFAAWAWRGKPLPPSSDAPPV